MIYVGPLVSAVGRSDVLPHEPAPKIVARKTPGAFTKRYAVDDNTVHTTIFVRHKKGNMVKPQNLIFI